MLTRRGLFRAVPLVAVAVAVAAKDGISASADIPEIRDKDLYGILYELRPVPDRFYYRGMDVRWTGWKLSQYDTSLKGQWFAVFGDGVDKVIVKADAISDMEYLENKKEMEMRRTAGLDRFCLEISHKQYDGTLTCDGPLIIRRCTGGIFERGKEYALVVA